MRAIDIIVVMFHFFVFACDVAFLFYLFTFPEGGFGWYYKCVIYQLICLPSLILLLLLQVPHYLGSHRPMHLLRTQSN